MKLYKQYIKEIRNEEEIWGGFIRVNLIIDDSSSDTNRELCFTKDNWEKVKKQGYYIA